MHLSFKAKVWMKMLVDQHSKRLSIQRASINTVFVRLQVAPHCDQNIWMHPEGTLSGEYCLPSDFHLW